MRENVMDEKARCADLLIPTTLSNNYFNQMRIVMALLVIWSHSFAIYYGTEDFEPVSLLLNGTFNAGNVGVRVFFAISGFLITLSYLRTRTLGSFLHKRIMRIYPGFLMAVAICAFVVIPLFSTHVNLSLASIARTIGGAFLLRSEWPASDVFTGPPHHFPAVNGALWSIPFEFWCYIATAALGLAGMLRHRLLILIAMVGILVGKIWLDFLGLKPGGGIIGAIIGWPYLWFSIAPCFLAGMLAYLYRDVIPRSRALAVALPIALVVSAHVARPLCEVLFPVVAAYLTFYIAFSRAESPEPAKDRGDFSYGTYLYGFPIQQMLLHAGLPFVLYMPAAMGLSVAAGAASWFLVERRFLVRKRRPEAIIPRADPAVAGEARSA